MNLLLNSLPWNGSRDLVTICSMGLNSLQGNLVPNATITARLSSSGGFGRRLNASTLRYSADAIEEAFRKLTHPDLPSLIANNHLIHKYLVGGVPVEYQRPDGSIGGDLVRVLDFNNADNNEFLAVNQFTVVEDRHERGPTSCCSSTAYRWRCWS